jgi:hypothetical protein
VFQIERNHFVNYGQRKAGKLAEDHLRGVALIVKMDDVLQGNPVPRQADGAVGLLRQEIR